jgi:hypothetical protein
VGRGLDGPGGDALSLLINDFRVSISLPCVRRGSAHDRQAVKRMIYDGFEVILDTAAK